MKSGNCWRSSCPRRRRARTSCGVGPACRNQCDKLINAINYVIRTGCQWDELPKDYPNHNSIYYHYRKWKNDGTWRSLNLTFTLIWHRFVPCSGGSLPNSQTDSEQLHDFIHAQGGVFDGRAQKHHELYLGDPRRAAPEKLANSK